MPSPHTSRGAAWNKLRQTVLERDHHTCAYCGREATTVDHVIAKANGGKDTLSNCVAACNECNGRKSDKPLIRNNWYNRDWIKTL